MIIYPENWRQFGKAITINDLDSILRQIISEIGCFHLSYSGGVDSSLLLYYLLEVKGIAKCFTVANDNEHPDIHYSRLGINYYEQRYRKKISHNISVEPYLEGDDLVQRFYSNIALCCETLIAGDGIDELAGGYYAHQEKLSEETYRDYLRRSQVEQLIPLNKNSGKVKVYLPYCDDRLASLLYRIPLYEKVDLYSRKIIICKLAQGKVPNEIILRRKYGFATTALGEGVAK